MPGRTVQADKHSITIDLSSSLPRIFDQAQISLASHQKNLVALYKHHAEAAQHTESVHNGKGMKLVGERAFEDVLLRILMRVLPMKKGTTQADRIVKFMGGYIKFLNEKAAEGKIAEEEEEDSEEESTASRFTAHLLKFLLRGFLAKDKSVRYRVTQTVAEMVSHLGEIDEEIYTNLRSALLDRIHDKEGPVRVQAVIALSKLAGSEDPSEVGEGEPTVVDVLIDMLAHDSLPDVRRAILLNIPITPITLPHILDRTRDTDTTIRKLVYSAVLETNTMQGDTGVMGSTHPRALTISQRELIVRNGLGDRESTVRAAAGSLIGKWVDVVSDTEPKTDDGAADARTKVESGVVALLKMLDLGESAVAADALLSVFVTRVDIFDNIEFGDAYWTNLTPEAAFLARVFVDHCKATKDDVRLEAALPVVTALAFRIQEAYNNLLETIQADEEERIIRDIDDEERVLKEDERIDQEFVIAEMLRLAENLDYSDEIGRRKMFQLARDMLSQEALPESLLARCLDVLRILSPNERDLIRVVVEIIQDLRDRDEHADEEQDPSKDADPEIGETPATVKTVRFPKPAAKMTPEEQAHADEIDLRCLSLCIGMLERVNSKLEENSTLDGILGELILPAVGRKEMVFREKGLISLGLCCLIARRMAMRSMELFISQMDSAPEALKISIIQVVFDMLMVHENDFLQEGSENAKKTIGALTRLLGDNDMSGKVRALLCIGIAKLVLAGMITDQQVVKNLIMVYLSPCTVDNQELRQCLTFFFPVYCYSSPSNQKLMQEIFIDVYKDLREVRRDLEDDEEMISATQFGALFVDWTDPLKLSRAADARGKAGKGQAADDHIQVEMARQIIEELFQDNLEKEDKKVLCQLLSKLHVPDVIDDYLLRRLKLLMDNLHRRRPLKDAVTNNAFAKFEATICKKFEKQLEDFNEEEYRKLEELKDIFDFVDSIIPEDDDDEVVEVDVAKRKGRKRRSESIISASTDAEHFATPPKRGKPKSKAKRRRLSTSDDESDEGERPAAVPLPTRHLPKRSAATKKPAQVIDTSSGSDEERTPGPPKGRTKPRSRAAKEEKTDEEIDDVLDEGTSEIPHDSIMDDSEDEEGEVNDLLVED